MPDPVNNTDSNASAPVEQTQSSDLSSQQITPPAAPAPVQQPMALQPSAAPPPAAVSKNPRLMHLVGSVLGGLAGPAPREYTTDASGKMTPKPAAPESAGAKARRIAQAALTGLAAGSQVGPQKSGLAALAAGVGAGAEAQTQKTETKDLQAKQEAKEEFEREQKARLQKVELGRITALTANNYRESRKLDLEMEPQRQAGLAVAQAAKDANIPGAETVPFSEWMNRLEKDPSLATEYVHMPAGYAPPTTNEDGTVTQGEGQVFILPATKGGEIQLPQQYLDQAALYGPLSGRFSSEEIKKLQAGHSIPVEQFASLAHATEEGRQAWLKGELTPELNWTGPNGDTPVLSNSVTHQPIKNMPAGTVPEKAMEEKKAERAEAAKSGLEAEQAKEAKAKADQALAEAALARQNLANTPKDPAALDALMKAYNNLPPVAHGILQNLGPEQQATTLALWAGRKDPKSITTNPRKGTGELSLNKYESMIHLFDPSWREDKYQTVAALDKEYSDPAKVGGQISSFGQFLQHAAEAKSLSDGFQRTNVRLLDTTFNKARTEFRNDPSVTNLGVAVTAARNEWETIINSGHVPSSDEKAAAKTLFDENSTVRQIAGALNIMGGQGVARLGELDERYKTATGSGWPNILDPKARDAARKLGLGEQITGFNTGGSLFSGSNVYAPGAQGGSQNPPSSQSGQQKVVDPAMHQSLQDAAKKYGTNPDKMYAVEGVGHISFNPSQKAWIVLETGKPYQAQ